MKTNEQTVADLIKRREEYDKKQLIRKRRLSKIAAVLAAVMIFAALSTVLFLAAKTNNAPAPAPAGTATETVPVVTADETKETPTEQATVKTETEIKTDPDTDMDEILAELEGIKEFIDVDSGDKLSEGYRFAASYNRVGEESEDWLKIPLIDLLKISDKTKEFIREHADHRDAKKLLNRYMTGVPHSDIMEWDVTIWIHREDFRNGIDEIDKNVFPMNIVVSEGIELLCDRTVMLNFENETTQTVRIRFKYKEGYSNGYMFVIMANEERQRAYDIAYVGGRRSVVFATIKGYDFDGFNPSRLYRFASIYFGDVDENGEPLYYNDPYMEDYYDNPWCQYLRGERKMDDYFYADPDAPTYKPKYDPEWPLKEQRGEQNISSLSALSKENNAFENSNRGDAYKFTV